jgi:hypothetical protein
MINTVIILIIELKEFKMPRGGVRSNSGAKGKWKHGKTKSIRVPEALTEQILEYARNLDESDIIESETESKINHTPTFDSVTESKTINLSGVSICVCNGKSAVLLEDLVKIGYDLYPERLGQIFKAVAVTRRRT